MKNLVFKFLVILFLVTNIIGCGCLKKQKQNNNSLMYGYEMLINNRQLDSICLVDNLNPHLDNWFATTFLDYETNKVVVQRMFIKELTDSTEAIYVLVEKDTLYLITKRIVKPE